MQIPVLIEPIAGNGYLARTGEPLALRAEGATEEEAVARLRNVFDAHLKNGGRVIGFDVSPKPHPLAKFAGMYSPDDPMVQEWIEIMAENRRNNIDPVADAP